MLRDELWMNKETGEILPATLAIKDYYKTHGALERWTDLWENTGDYADTFISFPDFINALELR